VHSNSVHFKNTYEGENGEDDDDDDDDDDDNNNNALWSRILFEKLIVT